MPRATDTEMAAWLLAAREDADRRGLPELKPLLDGLARSTAALRAADRAARECPVERPDAPDVPPPANDR
jgi:hypothetical protein